MCIRDRVQGDTWFPDFDPGQWQEAERMPGQSASGSSLRFFFVTLERMRMPARGDRAIWSEILRQNKAES